MSSATTVYWLFKSIYPVKTLTINIKLNLYLKQRLVKCQCDLSALTENWGEYTFFLISGIGYLYYLYYDLENMVGFAESTNNMGIDYANNMGLKSFTSNMIVILVS